MEFLGIGPLEFLVIIVIALIVVGPERLPEIARSIGKTLRDLRAMSEGLTAEWQQELSVVSDIQAGEKELQQALIEPFKEAQADLQRTFTVPLQEAQTDLQAVPSSSKQPAGQPQNIEESDASNDHTDDANA